MDTYVKDGVPEDWSMRILLDSERDMYNIKASRLLQLLTAQQAGQLGQEASVKGQWR